jgi:hypothetical protein
MSAILGKFASKMMKKDRTGAVAGEVKHLEMLRKTNTMKRDELEKMAASGNESAKYYAEMELRRRAGNKEMTRDLKTKQKEGKLTEKQVRNRVNANKERPMSSDSMRDSIRKQYDRENLDDDGFAKGGMVNKKPTGYAKGGMVRCGASVPASGGKGKK